MDSPAFRMRHEREAEAEAEAKAEAKAKAKAEVPKYRNAAVPKRQRPVTHHA